jgi:HAD superfamily hydrolase (TIGR01509 family)
MNFEVTIATGPRTTRARGAVRPIAEAVELTGLLLDFDGTLAETERSGHLVAYNRAFADLALPYRWDEALYGKLLAVAGGKERLAFYLQHERDERLSPEALQALVTRIYSVKQRRFAELTRALELRPGVRRLLLEAHAAGLRLGLVTTASPDGVEALLRHHPDLLERFELIAAGDVVAHKKPAPDIYRWALERMQLAASRCFALEDSQIGLRASLDAGLRTLVTVSAFTLGEDFTGAVAVLSDLGEPGSPARTLAGAAPPGGFVDVAYLHALAEREP